MGTALTRSESETNLALKAAAYEVPAWTVDGMDVLAVHDVAGRAVQAVRAGAPLFLELRTYRFRAHSMYDAERYRSKDEVARWRTRDPLLLLGDRLVAAGVLDEAAVAALEDEVRAEIDDAIAFAEAGTDEPVADLTRFVTSEPDGSSTREGTR
jgi:pyruvate dehydrogenase E1 component alpha subunit